MRTIAAAILTVSLFSSLHAAEPPARKVEPVPDALRKEFALTAHYQKCVIADGFPILAGAKVDDRALLEAAYLIDVMLGKRADIRQALVKNKVRFGIMARDEFTTVLPEHSDLRPAKYWDRRARGLGATRHRPAVSCGEENLLCIPGDPYSTENILIHEFAHAIHDMGLRETDRTFDLRLRKAYQDAMKAQLWKGKYAGSNRGEYWAEGVQSWFGTNRENDHSHNHVNTRAELQEYDPALAALVEEVFGKDDWSYQRPQQRKTLTHFEGFDFAKARPFEWPEELANWDDRIMANPATRLNGVTDITLSPMLKADPTLPKSKDGGKAVALIIANAGQKEIQFGWVDQKGTINPGGRVRPGSISIQDTRQGHVWTVLDEDGKPLGFSIATDEDCRLIVK